MNENEKNERCDFYIFSRGVDPRDSDLVVADSAISFYDTKINKKFHFNFWNRRRSAVFDGIWARLRRWKAREFFIKEKILNKETFIIKERGQLEQLHQQLRLRYCLLLLFIIYYIIH
jgi:hypothetical protein